MANTTYYNLNKPEQEEFYDVADFNANADIIDTELHNLDEKISNFVIFSDTEPSPSPGKLWLKPLE